MDLILSILWFIGIFSLFSSIFSWFLTEKNFSPYFSGDDAEFFVFSLRIDFSKLLHLPSNSLGIPNSSEYLYSCFIKPGFGLIYIEKLIPFFSFFSTNSSQFKENICIFLIDRQRQLWHFCFYQPCNVLIHFQSCDVYLKNWMSIKNDLIFDRHRYLKQECRDSLQVSYGALNSQMKRWKSQLWYWGLARIIFTMANFLRTCGSIIRNIYCSFPIKSVKNTVDIIIIFFHAESLSWI